MKPIKRNRALRPSDPMRLSHILRPCTLPGRWAALLLVGVVASAGISVTPAVAASGSMCNSYNPTLLKTGTTYKIVTKNYAVHSPPSTATADSKVVGLATFHGHKLIDIRHHVEIAYPVTKFSSTSDEFDKIGGPFTYYYGSRSQSGGETYSTPPMAVPKHYVIDKPYTSISVIRTSFNGTQSSSPEHVTTTFLGMESIKVPAGTFTTCKMKQEIFLAGETKPNISYSWIVSSGRYAGLNVKGAYYSATGASTGKMVALSLRVNGK